MNPSRLSTKAKWSSLLCSSFWTFIQVFFIKPNIPEAFVPGGGSSADSLATKQWLTESVPEMHLKSSNDICLNVTSFFSFLGQQRSLCNYCQQRQTSKGSHWFVETNHRPIRKKNRQRSWVQVYVAGFFGWN